MADSRTTSIRDIEKLPFWQEREISWLAYAKRILDEADDETVPLLERFGFMSFYQSGLRQFIGQRIGSMTDRMNACKRIAASHPRGSLDHKDAKERLKAEKRSMRSIYEHIGATSDEAALIYKSTCNRLRAFGIDHIFGERLENDLPEYQRIFLHDHLKQNVYGYLAPHVVDDDSPFPYLEDGQLYVMAQLKAKKASKGKTSKRKRSGSSAAEDKKLGIVALPQQCVRLIELPTGEGKNTSPESAESSRQTGQASTKAYSFVLLEEALCLFIKDIFPHYKVSNAVVVSLVRNADLDRLKHIDTDDEDYTAEVDAVLDSRAHHEPLLLFTSSALSKASSDILKTGLKLKSYQIQMCGLPLDMGYIDSLTGHLGEDIRKRLSWDPVDPKWLRSGPLRLNPNRSILDQVADHDVMLMYPYESMEPFEMMLDEAASDPKVSAIDMTIFRLADDSKIAASLMDASRAGKHVRLIMELRASCAEKKNIEWAERFEQAGCEVHYGLDKYKVHGKICCITRSVDGALQRITQIGTGNYDEKTSLYYTDFSFMTADPDFGTDAARLFDHLAKGDVLSDSRVLITSPVQLEDKLIDEIDAQIERARADEACGIFLKLDAITDKDLIAKLVEASQAGVPTVMIVRDACCILPGIDGYTEKIRVASLVGRLLEHGRIYGFGAWDDMRIYLSSADLMKRNMQHRVEIAWPIKNNILRKRVIQYANLCLNDTAKLRELLSDGSYTALGALAKEDKRGRKELFDSQEYLLHKG